MLLPITLTFAAACALLNLWLAIRCARFRIKDKVMHGDAGHALLARRMRAHANFVEYTPIVLILTGLVELAAGASLWLWIMALVYILARVAHAFGMDADKPTLWRGSGALLTWAITAALAVTALTIAYGATREIPAPPAMAANV
ncbi:MAPEG family protein [Sphingobium olei]|uniref:MAPEG family protein n=1 Tax=Sphingobium olei TaxID=420955 RepID=A0ABW3P5S1_9SPHN|nr:MAPEG family protein [Sphingobium sp.]